MDKIGLILKSIYTLITDQVSGKNVQCGSGQFISLDVHSLLLLLGSVFLHLLEALVGTGHGAGRQCGLLAPIPTTALGSRGPRAARPSRGSCLLSLALLAGLAAVFGGGFPNIGFPRRLEGLARVRLGGGRLGEVGR